MSQLVSWCFEPIQPQGITSGLIGPCDTTGSLLSHIGIVTKKGHGVQRERYCDTKNPVRKELSPVTYRDCDEKGMVHKENVTVTQRTLRIKSSLL